MKKEKEWWEKPGLGIMYQIEARPGWRWNRDYNKFNASMQDENGNLKFNGPFCKMKDWVALSKRVGVDYHVFEAKWHDGICYWDTKYTEWKTPKDYCKDFAEESKKNDIPFLWYYSNIFDHNPQFDEIQPLRSITPSFIALHKDSKEEVVKYCINFGKALLKMFENIINEDDIPREENLIVYKEFTYNPEIYEDYLLKQVKELIENYKVDGMWMDWYWDDDDAGTFLVMDLLEKEYPNIVLTYNQSINKKVRYAHYLSGEAHDVKAAWNLGNKYRRMERPWELCGPAAKMWDDPRARPDPFEIFRIAAIIIASGGKYCFGLPSQMNGEMYPEPAKNVELFGEWYKQRTSLFRDAIPMDYKSKSVPGVEISDKDFGVIGAIHEGDNLIHLINLEGKNGDITLKFSLEHWENIKKIILEPMKTDVDLKKEENKFVLSISKENIDKADTIIRICK
ncbi:MAG: hypothetical protein EU529_09075 [Promethearchaeota archaeon]|nr:MAG: hypothetical protein EU529_09075 [Candidatus Lokiarchaeota archaeon]